MKILVTVDTYSPLSDGVQNITQNHVEQLSKKGHEVIVLTQQFSGTKRSETINNIKVHRYNLYTKYGLHFGEIEEYRKMVKKLANEVHVMINTCIQSATTDLILKDIKELKCKKVLYLHGMYEFSYEKRDLKSVSSVIKKGWFNLRWTFFYQYYKKNLTYYDEIINLNFFDKATSYFEKKYGYKVKIINNFVEDRFLNYGEVNCKKDQIVCVSNFSSLKNQLALIDMIFDLSIEKKMNLVLVGSEKNEYYIDLRKRYEQLKEKKALIDVEFKICIKRDEIAKIVAESKVFVLASKVEKVPVVILESMAVGTPFVSSNIGCVKYLPGGFIANNDEEFKYYLKLLLKEDEITNSMGKIAKQYAIKNFSLIQTNNELEKILLQLTERGEEN